MFTVLVKPPNRQPPDWNDEQRRAFVVAAERFVAEAAASYAVVAIGLTTACMIDATDKTQATDPGSISL